MTLFFPFIAAALYGLGYVLVERTMESINVFTYMVIGILATLIALVGIWYFKGEAFSFNIPEANKWPTFAIIFLAAMAPTLGWVFTVYAIKDISPLYTAFAEVSYPLFIPLFAFLLFGARHLQWQTLLGGALIMAGAAVLILGQLSFTQNN